MIHYCMKIWEVLHSLMPHTSPILKAHCHPNNTPKFVLLCHRLANNSNFHLPSWFLGYNHHLFTHQNEWNCNSVMDLPWQGGRKMDIRVGINTPSKKPLVGNLASLCLSFLIWNLLQNTMDRTKWINTWKMIFIITCKLKS